MDLANSTDEEIRAYSADVANQLIKAASDKDWQSFSSPFIAEGQTSEAKENVENQWETNPVLTSFKQEPEFLGVLRRTDHIVTLWKMKSRIVSDDILGLLAFTEIAGETKVYGFRIN